MVNHCEMLSHVPYVSQLYAMLVYNTSTIQLQTTLSNTNSGVKPMTIIETGDIVRFKGAATVQQARWANADYPSDLNVGETYVVERVERETWCTRITLQNTTGVFNSVHFSRV